MTSAPSTGLVQGIVWIASYPKSGNTWVRSFLHALLHLRQGGGREAPDINAMNLYSTWDISSKDYETFLGKPPQEATREDIAAVRCKVQEEIANFSDGLSFVKTHNALVMDRGHPAINGAVTSGALYLARNPLDVAISFAHHFGTGLDEAIRRMETQGLETPVTDTAVYEIYGSWSQHVASWTERSNRAVFVARYEDMLAEPEATFAAMARHLLILATPDQVRTAIERSSFDTLRRQEDEAGFREKPRRARRFFRKGRAGEWREALSRDQVARVVAAHRGQMLRFGYVPDGF